MFNNEHYVWDIKNQNFSFQKLLLWCDQENFNIGIGGGLTHFCHGLNVTHGGIDLFCSPHSYVRLKDYFIVNNLFLCDTEYSDVPFKSIHLIKKTHLQNQIKNSWNWCNLTCFKHLWSELRRFYDQRSKNFWFGHCKKCLSFERWNPTIYRKI